MLFRSIIALLLFLKISNSTFAKISGAGHTVKKKGGGGVTIMPCQFDSHANSFSLVMVVVLSVMNYPTLGSPLINSCRFPFTSWIKVTTDALVALNCISINKNSKISLMR